MSAAFTVTSRMHPPGLVINISSFEKVYMLLEFGSIACGLHQHLQCQLQDATCWHIMTMVLKAFQLMTS